MIQIQKQAATGSINFTEVSLSTGRGRFTDHVCCISASTVEFSSSVQSPQYGTVWFHHTQLRGHHPPSSVKQRQWITYSSND